MSVGEELDAVLLDGAFEATTTMTIVSATGSATIPSEESNDPMMIADIATMANIRERRNLILRCFHHGRGGASGSTRVPMYTSSSTSSTKTASGTLNVES